jgi:hypothetical protein
MRASPLLLTDEVPVEVLMVLTVEAIELCERVLRVDITDGELCVLAPVGLIVDPGLKRSAVWILGVATFEFR